MTSTTESIQSAQAAAGPLNEPGVRVPTLGSSGLASPPIAWWGKVHCGLLLVALALLVVAGQGQHFFRDDWAFVGGKLDVLPFPELYLLPHNEHWTLLPLLAYRTLRASVGVGSYWPYLGLLLLLHLGVTHVLWRLMLVTGSMPIVATALAAVFSVLGAAAENLVWAFQISFVGSTLFGVSAVYLAVTGTANWRKTGVLAGLILASLATSGVGLAYLVVVPLVLARRRRRYAVAVFGLPMLVYLPWYAMYGHRLAHPPNVSTTLPLTVGAFVLLGLVAALTGYFGFAANNTVALLAVGVPIVAGCALACREWIADRTLTGRTFVAMTLGAVSFFTTAALAREGLGLGIAGSPRYIYVSIALLLPGISVVISSGVNRHPPLLTAIVPVAIAIALSNLFQLFTFAAETRQANDTSQRVLVAASDLVRSKSSIFINQLPEPMLAPDLTTADLRSRNLDPALAGSSPRQADRLTASVNLQIQVARVAETGTTSACRTTPEPQITIPTGRNSAPSLGVNTAASVAFTLHDASAQSAPRVLLLSKGTYKISSLRETADLTIQSTSPASLLLCPAPYGSGLGRP
jgi:hypothetical protein